MDEAISIAKLAIRTVEVILSSISTIFYFGFSTPLIAKSIARDVF